ncbi:MAG: SAM-dependent methyltransferase [Candidatus Neomarinimicrobiota bacterium]
MVKREYDEIVPSSFRDPSGFLFYQNGVLYRKVNPGYKDNYDFLIKSGLYDALVEDELLIPHMEIDENWSKADDGSIVIQPEPLQFISYPYEWCFSQLKNAALLTLRIQKRALEFGMSLKDCSAYNLQFKNCRPIFIDTLSFEKYVEGPPWVAYRQFCQHFVAPLAIMSYKDIRLNQLSRVYIDSIPLDLASVLLPMKTYLNPRLLMHVHLHSRSQKHFATKTFDPNRSNMKKQSFMAILDNLEKTVKKLNWQIKDTEWTNYSDQTNYSTQAFVHKKQIVAEFIDRLKPSGVWDLGSNIGIYSRIASNRGIPTISFDNDPGAVEKNYLNGVSNGELNILPLLLDLTNPSPATGWENKERMNLLQRGPTDTILALALVHHLAISTNMPLKKIASFFSTICSSIIIEFVPKTDSQVQKLLSTREDIFPEYTQANFESVFRQHFNIQRSAKIIESDRTIYLMTPGCK